MEEAEAKLRTSVLKMLTALLSPDQSLRQAAEQQIKIFEVMEDFGVLLTEMCVDQTRELALRQLASLLLKHYVETHWNSLSDKFCQPETTPPAKAAIKQMLPLGLCDASRKIRASAAYAISAIAHWDWPEEWPQLFPQLMEAIMSADLNSVHGAMRVLTEFSRDLSDVQMPQVAPIVLPEMLKIFVRDDVYSIRTRSRSVEIFKTCTALIYSTDNETLINALLPDHFVSEFIQAFVNALHVPNGPASDCGLKKEILKALINMMRDAPSKMGSDVPSILSAVWQQLTQGAQYFVSREINCLEEDAETVIDSDGESLSFGNLVYSLFDFVETLLDSNVFRKTVRKSLPELLYYLIIYMQITEEQVASWLQNPDQFVEDEDEESFSFSVRLSAQDLFLACCQRFKSECATALVTVVAQLLKEAEEKKSSGLPHWWKIHESCFLALGSVQSLIVESISKSLVQFDFSSFLTNVVLEDLKADSPFLIGRSLWIASRFVALMPHDMVKQFLEATVCGLQGNQSLVVRICTVRSIFAFCDHLSNPQFKSVLIPFLSPMIDGLLQFVGQASVEVLALILESMIVIIPISRDVTIRHEDQISSLAIAVFLKYANDPLVSSLASDVLSELAEYASSPALLEAKLLPTIVSIFNADKEKMPSGLVSMATDILCNVVKKLKPPIPASFYNSGFPAMIKVAISSDDNSVLQSAGECTRYFITTDIEQLYSWSDEHGNSGPYYVMQLISVLLSPKLSEFSASLAGRLVSVFLTRSGDRMASKDVATVLRSVLSKLQQSMTLTVVQSLIMVFAQLINRNVQLVVDFLSSVPGPSNNSALEFVLTEWCDKQGMFFGSYDKKVSAIALSHLLEHGLATRDEKLSKITVKGDQIFAEGVRTRSKTAKEPEKWTTIPLLVKIYKLLLNEIANQIESSTKKGSFFEWDEGSSESEDMDPDDGKQTLAQLLNDNSVINDFDEDDDEEELMDANDPVNQIDLFEYLTTFVKQFSKTDVHKLHFVNYLNVVEKEAFATTTKN